MGKLRNQKEIKNQILVKILINHQFCYKKRGSRGN